VVGAGVVGLAVARALAMDGREVLILEAEDAIGTHTSSRNSEVIHAGLYYPAGSLKARLCVAGRQALYAYCAGHGVAHERIGKLVVATAQDEVAQVRGYLEQGRANGVTDLQWLDAPQVHALEPDVRAVGGFLSPSTGIVDSHGLMLALLSDAERHGAVLALRSPVVGGRVDADGIHVDVGGAAPLALRCRTFVNAAGLGAPALAARLANLPRAHVPRAFFAKAHYFTLRGASPFRRLVYPVASEAFLGVHVTLDLAGRARFGPDVQWVDDIDYGFDESRAPLFYAAIRRYWPGLPDGALQPGYTGMRPKIAGPGQRAADFRIDGPAVHGGPGLVNLFGIESPGLTACLAIAGHAAALVGTPRNTGGGCALQAAS
jgi:L-2-hydroxyglutarate oxidase LhgO